VSILEEELPTLCRPTVWFEEDKVLMLDRRTLPDNISYIELHNYEEVAKAIEDMVIQGAGSIAIAAGYGIVLTIAQNLDKSPDKILEIVKKAARRLESTRPTGPHIKRITNLLVSKCEEVLNIGGDVLEEVKRTLQGIVNERRITAELCGKYAAELLVDGDTILTHCFPGPALVYMLLAAKKEGKKVKVFATETRPYLQGARLTCFTLLEAGFDTTLITDNMVGYCMWKGLIKKVFVAADRIALDGSIANKVGTYIIALAAFHNDVPFYVLGYKC